MYFLFKSSFFVQCNISLRSDLIMVSQLRAFIRRNCQRLKHFSFKCKKSDQIRGKVEQIQFSKQVLFSIVQLINPYTMKACISHCLYCRTVCHSYHVENELMGGHLGCVQHVKKKKKASSLPCFGLYLSELFVFDLLPLKYLTTTKQPAEMRSI